MMLNPNPFIGAAIEQVRLEHGLQCSDLGIPETDLTAIERGFARIPEMFVVRVLMATTQRRRRRR